LTRGFGVQKKREQGHWFEAEVQNAHYRLGEGARVNKKKDIIKTCSKTQGGGMDCLPSGHEIGRGPKKVGRRGFW